jgi:shikimate kinase
MNPVFLIGFMGSGKTTLGKLLASKLNCPFLDSDREIEIQQNATINQLFAEKGEDYFRSLENKFINDLSENQFQVVAVGGGLPCFNGLMEILDQKGVTVYIKTSENTLFHRLMDALNERPLLEGLGEEELKQFITEKLKEREPIYSKAHLVVEEVDQTTEKLIRLLLPLQRN